MLRAGQMVIVPAKPTDIPEPLTIDLKQLLATSRLLESGGFKPLFSDALIQKIAQGQGGGRPKFVPNAPNQAQQAAQTARNTTQGPPSAPPRPAPTPPASAHPAARILLPGRMSPRRHPPPHQYIAAVNIFKNINMLIC